MNPEHLSILNQGIFVWNQWRDERPEVMPDLSGADLSKVNLSKAKLGRTNLSSATLSFADLSLTDLEDANLSESNLSSAILDFATLRQTNLSRANLSFTSCHFADCDGANLSNTNLSFADLSNSNLTGTTLSRADLSCSQLYNAMLMDSDLSGANLSSANLGAANLTAAHALTANFSQATLTGAIVAYWHIGDETQLRDVDCDYIYSSCHPSSHEPSGRLPVDPTRTFAPGEFLTWLQSSPSSATIRLQFTQGIYWPAFLGALQKLHQQYPEAEVILQGIQSQKGTLVITLKAAPGADKPAIEKAAYQLYEVHLGIVPSALVSRRHGANGERRRSDYKPAIAPPLQPMTPMDILMTLADSQSMAEWNGRSYRR